MSENTNGNKAAKERQPSYSPMSKFVYSSILLQVFSSFVSFFILLTVLSFTDSKWGPICTTVFGTLFTVVLIYKNAWMIAEKDRNLVKFGHIKADKYKGIVAGLYSAIPLFVITAAAVLQAYTGILPDWWIYVYRTITCNFIALTDVFLDFAPVLLLVYCLIPPVASWCGYKNGFVLKRFFETTLYQKKSSDNDKRVR